MKKSRSIGFLDSRLGASLATTAVCAVSLFASRWLLGADRPKPPGEFLRPASREVLQKTTFRADQPIVGTYYFYWYDQKTGEHFIDHDGTDALTDHPLEPEGYSYRSADWHYRELRDMLEAGLDFLLPVYWGYPGAYGSWSFVGLPPLVEACRRLEKEGKKPPKIGLFYDTSTLQWNSKGYHADLTTLEGKEWLYVSARDFFSLIPPDLWACVDGRPLLWLYSAAFAKRQDPAALEYLRREFERDFGVRPYIVKEISWQGEADATYAWGAALRPNHFGVAAVGPGYDHSAVPGRAPLVRDREGGKFYSRSWEWQLSRDPSRRAKIAVVETWNELHEGTEIAPSREHGRLYVELTRKYADLWRRGARLPRPGEYGAASEVSVELGEKNASRGISQRDLDDGVTKPARAAGKEARSTAPNAFGGRYIYFDVDDSFYSDDAAALELEVEYLDGAGETLVLEYDSADREAPHAGAFKPAPAVKLEGTGTWRTARFRLEDAAFTGRSNGADFRLSVPGGDLTLRRVALRRLPEPEPKTATR